jgi:hypothetical protein
MYIDGVGWTDWTAPYVYDVPQAASTAWFSPAPFYMRPAGTRWVTVYMAVRSLKAGGYIGADYLLTDRVDGDLTESSGIWCRNRI